MKQLLPTVLLSSLTLTTSALSAHPISEQNSFFNQIKSLCGKAYTGKITEDSENDVKLAKQVLTMHIRKCSDDKLEIPFHIGDNASRTWVLTKSEKGLSLAHDHRHKDGSSDKVTMYGGTTAENGTANHQSFPVDQFSKTMFKQNQLTASVDNTWHMVITPKSFKYKLTRPNRVFTAEFDLTNEVKTPPTPWGHE